MRCRWREWLVAGTALTPVQPGAAQQIRELGIGTVLTFSDPTLAVAGLYGAVRTSGRTRLSVSLGAGVSDGELAGRAELLGHFLLSPEERRRAGFYFAGGFAGVEGSVSRGYLVLTVGVEERPRASSGLALEFGVGGGVRIGVAYRWRWFPAVRLE
jgi:hypothetical protein